MSDSREQRELEFSDAFLTELSQGIDRSEGADPLAGMLLELRDDVEKPMPAAPRLQAQVVDLRSRRPMRPLFAGLMGAAAATLVIAGSGAVLLNAGPDSPLYGLSTTLFPRPDSTPAVVELAGTLEEMNNLAERGDMDGVRLLIEQARLMAKDMEVASRAANSGAPVVDAPSSGETPRAGKEVTVTVTTTVPGAPAPQPAAGQEGQQNPKPAAPNASERPAAEPQATVTETQTVTVTATVTAVQEEQTVGGPVESGAGAGYVEPTVASVIPGRETPALAGLAQGESSPQTEGTGE